MVLTVIATVLILAVALFYTTQGLFSAIIMSLLSVLSAAAAMNYYEPFSTLLQGSIGLSILYADAIALVVLFAAPLFLIRLGFDRLVKSNVVFGVWVERVGSAAFGAVVGMVLVGVLTLALQMLPFGPGVFTYRPYDRAMRRQQRLAPFFPDDFVLALANMLSDGSLSTDRRYATLHSDLLLRLQCDRTCAGEGAQRGADPDAINILKAYQIRPDQSPRGKTLAAWLASFPENPLLSDAEHERSRIVVLRVAVDVSAAQRMVIDENKQRWWVLPAMQFRLAYPDGRNFWPIGYLTSPSGDRDTRGMSQAQIDQWRLWTGKRHKDTPSSADLIVFRQTTIPRSGSATATKIKELAVDWVFRLPPAKEKKQADDQPDDQPPKADQEPSARPMHLVFRQVAAVKTPTIEILSDLPKDNPTPETGPLSHRLRTARRDMD
ncbi:MAG: CvpA family protein [Planctomycetota bacterium]|jgi:hypothetical protein